MNNYFTVQGTDNVVDLKKYKTYKEAFRFFTHYKTKVSQMFPDDIAAERVRLTIEKRNFPEHLLTKVKLQIFENATGTKV